MSVTYETNKYAESILSQIEKLLPRSRYNKWQDVNDQIIKAFVAVEIGKGLVHKATLESHFQDTYWLTQTPGFNTVFKRDKYQLISPSFIFPTMMMNLQKLIDFQKSSP